MAGFCITCVKITSYAGVFLFIIFGIFSFAGFRFFKDMAKEIDEDFSKNKLGAEFLIAAAVYLVISILLFFKTREPGEKKIIQTPEEEEKINKFRETIRTFSSGEVVDQIIRDNKMQDSAQGPLFPEDKNDDDNDNIQNDTPYNSGNVASNSSDQTPNLLEEQITSKKEEEPAIDSQNEKLVNDVGPLLGEESKQENSGAKDEVPLVTNEENQS